MLPKVAFLTLHVLHAKHPYLVKRYARSAIACIDFLVIAVPQVLAIIVPEITWMLYVALVGLMITCLVLAVPYVALTSIELLYFGLARSGQFSRNLLSET